MTLWPHQVEAVEFATSRQSTMLACGMGTGKTRMALEIRQRIAASRVLVVAPLGVVTDGAWAKNAEKFDQQLTVLNLEGTVAEKARKLLRELRSTTQTY
jgi:SNF2 family DNA or RNA helicase